ncbi:MAG: ATPase, partial [Lachnospiraceae bacterium]|nr:ATPase [Lachnospiraceae bacterium]
GNPPEFNKAVREFDVVTLDRLKVIEVEADYPAWKRYGTDAGLHGAILNFIEVNREYFYGVETTAFGKNYVTARGWEDLSDMIRLYEEAGKKVTESLIGQYIKNDTIVKEFAAYYDLYNKYKKSYDIEAFFKGSLPESTADEISRSKIDERLALTGLLSDMVKTEIKDIMDKSDTLKEARASIARITSGEETDPASYIMTLISAREKFITDRGRAGSLTPQDKTRAKRVIALYNDLKEQGTDAEVVKTFYNDRISALKKNVIVEQMRIDNLFASMTKVFGEESNEMLLLVTELTLGKKSAEFFASFGSDSYEKYNALLMVDDRKETLRREILDIL